MTENLMGFAALNRILRGHTIRWFERQAKLVPPLVL